MRVIGQARSADQARQPVLRVVGIGVDPVGGGVAARAVGQAEGVRSDRLVQAVDAVAAADGRRRRLVEQVADCPGFQLRSGVVGKGGRKVGGRGGKILRQAGQARDAVVDVARRRPVRPGDGRAPPRVVVAEADDRRSALTDRRQGAGVVIGIGDREAARPAQALATACLGRP